MNNRVMKNKINRHLTCLLIILSIGTCYGEPEPLPGMIYTENFADDTDGFLLLERLKQVAELKNEMIEDEQELKEAQYEIQAMLEAKTRNHRLQPIQSEFPNEQSEMLPIPSARVNQGSINSGKRTSYMALCHFKICNMGRKRQSRADLNGKL